MNTFLKARKITILLSFPLLALLVSCKKDGMPWWDADFSGPVAKSSLTIGNLLPDSMLTSDPDSSVRIVYNAAVFNYAVDTLVQIPATTIESNYTIPFGSVGYGPSQPLFGTSPAENFFDVDNVNLTYAIIKSGRIKLEATNNVADPMVFNYDLLKSVFGGSNFSIAEEIPGGSIANPGSLVKYYDVAGLEVDFTGLNSDKYNAIVTQQVVSMSATANAGTISAGQGLVVKITFMDIVPLYAKGYLGNETIAVTQDTITFDFLKNLSADYFALQDANVNLKVTNGFGVDMSVSNVLLTSYNSFNNTSQTLSGSGVLSTFNLNRASYTGNSSNPVVENVKNYPLNSSNSNVKAFIENLPNKIIYSMNGQINPLGNVSGNNDFVYYGYGFRTDLEMDIPFAFAATNLRLQDTVEVSFSDMNESENINHGQLTLRATNGFPFDADLQAYLCDANNVITDSLFSIPSVVVSANVDASLKVTSPTLSQLYIPIDHEKIHKLRGAKYIIFKMRLNTASQIPSAQVIKIYDYYKMDLVLTADINYSVNKQE